MSDDRRRRRRPAPGARRAGGASGGLTPWLITIGAALAVIAAGWFLGQALAHAFGGKSQTQTAQTQPTSVPIVTPLASPSATPEATPVPSPSAAPSTEPSAEPPSAEPTPSAAPSPEPPTPRPTRAATASPEATLTPSPPPEPTKHPHTPAPSPSPSAPPSVAPHIALQSDTSAKQTVRSYIEALMRGDPQAAAAYLGNGVPDESFINAQTHIQSIAETVNADGSSNVEVLMQTTGGEYRETFQVAPGSEGTRILDKSATHP